MAEGSYQEVQTSGYDIVKFIEHLEETTIESEIEVFDQNNETLDRNQNSPLKGSNGNNSSSFIERKSSEAKERPVVVAESRSSGQVSNNILLYFSAVGSTCKVIMFFSTFIITQVFITGVELWISFWYCMSQFTNKNSFNSLYLF